MILRVFIAALSVLAGMILGLVFLDPGVMGIGDGFIPGAFLGTLSGISIGLWFAMRTGCGYEGCHMKEDQ